MESCDHSATTFQFGPLVPSRAFDAFRLQSAALLGSKKSFPHATLTVRLSLPAMLWT